MPLNRQKVIDKLKSPATNISAVARVAGCTPQALYNIRDGRSTPTADIVDGVARAFQIPIGYFFDEEEPQAV